MGYLELCQQENYESDHTYYFIYSRRTPIRNLGVRGYDIWTARLVRTCTLETGSIEVAVFGLLGKMTGGAAIIDSQYSVTENGKRVRVHVQLKALGTLGIWVNDPAGKEERWKTKDMLVMIQGKAVPEDKVKVSDEGIDAQQQGTRVVEVDVQGAWREMELDASWSNEVGVETFFS